MTSPYGPNIPYIKEVRPGFRFTFSIEGDYYDDKAVLNNMLRYDDYISANEHALEMIRRKMKYEIVPDQWAAFLEDLRRELTVD